MKAIATIIFFLLVESAMAATWYVDNTASGTHDGTSWATAYLDITNIPSVLPGDSIYISGGLVSQTYHTTGLNFTGSSSSPILISVGQDSSHGGIVIFDGTGTINYWANTMQWVNITGNYNGATNIVVTNCFNSGALVGTGWLNLILDHISFYGALTFNGGTNVILSYDSFYCPNGADHCVNFIVTGPNNNGFYTNNQIHNCLFAPVYQLGVNSQGGSGDDCLQDGQFVSVYSNKFSPVLVANYTGNQHQDGWQTLGVYSACFDNVFENIPGYCVFAGFEGSISNVLIYNNTFRVSGTNNSVGLGVYVGYTTGGSPQPYTFTNICVLNNTFVDCLNGQGALGMGNSFSTNFYTNCYCLNNLIFNSGNGGNNAASYLNNKTGVTLNSFTSGNLVSFNYLESGISGNTNFYMGTNVQVFVPPTGNVQFISYAQYSTNNNLHLAANDRAVTKAGTNLTALFLSLGIAASDKDGVARPSSGNWDIGAFQNVAVATGGTSISGNVGITGKVGIN